MEQIGRTMPTVCEIYDHRQGEFVKKQIRAFTDYSGANSVGTRGIRYVFFLQPGRVYEVVDPQSWKRTERYYCRVNGDRINRIGIGEVFSWLRMG
jgi:hypothetical protein